MQLGFKSSLLATALMMPGLTAAEAAPGAADHAEVGAIAGVEANGDGEGFADDQAIIVTGKLDGYRTVETRTGTKTATPVLDVPQAVTVITAAQIRDQAILSVTDLVRLVPGVSAGQGEGHRDQITLRGNNSTADFFIDGLRDDVQYYRSFYNIERVEVHKGPNAMVFGRGGGGGILNRVSKGALHGSDFADVQIAANSFGGYLGAIDANVDFGSSAGRLNAFYESIDNHRDFFGGDRLGINPVVGFDLGEKSKLQLGYEYFRDTRVVDRGIPSAFTGSLATPAGPADGLRDTFFGVRGVNMSDFDGHVLRADAETELGGGFSANAHVLYGDYDKAYTNAYAATAIGGTPAAPTVEIEAYRDLTTRQNFIAQANVEWRGDTGGIGHVILFGVEYTAQDTTSERINGFFDPLVLSSANRRRTVAVTDPVVIPAISFVAGAAGNGNRAVASDLSQWSAYIQDQITLGGGFEIVAGLRYDRFDLGLVNNFNGQVFERVDDLWSPRLGIVYKPVPEASLYASYSKSYLPQSGDQFVGLDATSAALEPEVFDNYEIGAKWDVAPRLTATAAVYQLERGNTRATGPTPGSIVLTGAQRTRGVELGLTGQVTKAWQASFGYAYTEAEITETTSAAPAGRRVAQVPRHQLSLWNRVDVTDMLGFGLGVYHQGESFATISNATLLPAYTRVDAALFVKLNERLSAQLNVENLFDARYFPVAHNDNNISTGAPINARVSIAYRF